MNLEKARRDFVLFRIVYAALTANFVVPAVSYAVAPQMALATLDRVNRLLGGGAFPASADGVWHMLAVGNVMTLGFMCALILADVRRFFPVLPALVFLKGFSALYALFLGAHERLPAFYAVTVLDGSTTAAMIVFATRGRRAAAVLPEPRSPWYVRAVLPFTGRVEATLDLVREAGLVPRTPTTFQVLAGVLRMQHRLVFQTSTVGTSTSAPVRKTWRARLLRFRTLRLPALIVERAVAPFDLSGLASPPERIIRHLLGAHHDGVQFAYDLELLALHPGALETLRDRVREVVDGVSPRAEWLRDLVVYDGYHEALLAATERVLGGGALLSADQARDPDLSLCAFLAWCAERPASLGAYFSAASTASAQRAGSRTFDA